MEAIGTLVQQAQAGRLDAYETIVRRFQDMAVGYAYGLLGDFHLAEDAAQEAFLMGYQRLIEMLPERERLATTLFYIGEYSHEEVAAFMEVPTPSVNNYLRAARRKLKTGILEMAKRTLKQNAPSGGDEFANVIGICNAALAGDVERVQAIVQTNPDLIRAKHPELSRGKIVYRPIHLAAQEGHVGVVTTLLEAGDDPIGEFFHNYQVPCALSLAKDRGHYEVVSVIEAHILAQLERNADLINASWSEAENTLLHLAVYHSHAPLVRVLLERGAAIDQRNALGQKPIHLALYDGMGGGGPVLRDSDLLMAGLLLDRGAECDIWVASAIGDVARVRRLLSKKPELADQNNGAERYPYGSNFPLGIAVHNGHIEVVRALLDYGVDPDLACPNRPFAETEKPESGSPLIFAIARKHFGVAHLLLDRGARVDFSLIDSGPSIVDEALRSGNESLIERVIVKGGKPLLGHHVGTKNYLVIRELLDRCPEGSAHSGDRTILEEFLLAGVRSCDPNVVAMCLALKPTLENGRGNWEVGSAGLLYHVIRYAYYVPEKENPDWDACERVMGLLLDYGVNVNDAEESGTTALHHLSTGHMSKRYANDDLLVKFAGLLLAKGADINAVDNKLEMTPLGWAARYNRKPLVKFFLEHDADPTLPTDKPENRPLAIAEKLGFSDVAAMLRRADRQ